MNITIENYLDSTYLKTPEQSGLTSEATEKEVRKLVQECIDNGFVLAMIRPEYITMARTMIDLVNADVLVGTVIGFHEGTYSIEDKLTEAKKAIADGADELDFVINYTAFKNGEIDLVKREVYEGTKIGLAHDKAVKWIIEIAALTDDEIAGITHLIRDVVLQNFDDKDYPKVYVKSSTGFYKTTDGKPNGATFEGMQIIKDNAGPLSIKAAGGVRNYDDAVKMIALGVNRIGTSSAKAIADGSSVQNDY
ncbi:MAG: deoxyribose-phosphate aldolase [Flavobacteriia bacterium]|nr:MAG: deoxyribose-phosphate aldolase [Flavobacteriia bacterium]